MVSALGNPNLNKGHEPAFELRNMKHLMHLKHPLAFMAFKKNLQLGLVVDVKVSTTL